MVILRLRRQGRSHDAHYRIVAQEKRSKLNGKYIEAIGHYHPTNVKDELVVDKERVEHWLKNGAQISDSVTNLLVKEGILPKERKVSRVYSLKKKEEARKAEEAKAPKAEATAEEVKTEAAEEAPAEEPATEEAQPEEPKTEEEAVAPAEDSVE